jgi:hypothetical protein
MDKMREAFENVISCETGIKRFSSIIKIKNAFFNILNKYWYIFCIFYVYSVYSVSFIGTVFLR